MRVVVDNQKLLLFRKCKWAWKYEFWYWNSNEIENLNFGTEICLKIQDVFKFDRLELVRARKPELAG